jgi:hypothetical protein
MAISLTFTKNGPKLLINLWVVFFEPVDTDDHWFVSQVGYVEGKTFAVFSNLDNEGDGMSDLSMVVGAPVGVANNLR